MRTARRLFLRMFLVATPCLLVCLWAFAQDQPVAAREAQIESEAVFRLAEFVEWPPAKNSQQNKIFNFCILGVDTLGDSLDKAVLGHPIRQAPTMIVRGSRLGDMGRCDVLFITASKAKRLPEILSKLRGKNVLTVSEMPDFAALGGIVEFSNDGNHISFAINVDAAQKAGLRIRAQLLSLAKIVHGNGNSSQGDQLISRE